MQYSDLEGGCWQFVTDDGVSYQPVGGPANIYTDGLSGILTGDVNPDLMSTCMVGPIVEVCGFGGDKIVNMVGTLHFSGVENGCWILETGNDTYQPISIDGNFFVDGAKVKVTGIVKDVVTVCMVGPVFDVFDYQFLGKGCNSEPAAKSACCQPNYAHCAKTCRENQCFISCGTVYDICSSSR